MNFEIDEFGSIFLKVMTVVISISLILFNIWLIIVVPAFLLGKVFSMPLMPSIVLWSIVIVSVLPVLFGVLGMYKALTFSPYAYRFNTLGRNVMGILSLIQILIPIVIYFIVNKYLPCMLGTGQVAGIIFIHALVLSIILKIYLCVDKHVCYNYSKKNRKSNICINN